MSGFLFGGNTGVTQEGLQRRRAMAEAMLAKATSHAPRNVGEGLNALGQAIAGRALAGRVDRDEQQARQSANEEFAPILASLSGRPMTSPAYQATSGGGLPSSLIQSESGGDYLATNDVPGSGGVGHFGRGQFSQGRLQDAIRAGVLPEGTTPQQFLQSPEMQQTMEQWHVQDINSFMQDNNLLRYMGQDIGGTTVTPEGALAVAHLGGNAGLQRFLETGGQYNPADANGTHLSDYLAMHGGQTAQQRPQAAPQPGSDLSMAQLLQVADNPFLSQGQRAVLNGLMQQRMQQSDPMRQLEIQRLQQELATGAPGYISPIDQQRLDLDRDRFAFEREGAGRTDDTAEYEFYVQQERAAGREPAPYLDFITAQRRAGASSTVVNNNQGDSVAIEEISKDAVEQSSAFIEAGQQASRAALQIDELDRLLQSAPQGARGAFIGIANGMGIQIEGGDEVAAAEAIINQMVPAQRPPGSGTMSDADLRLFQSSLPRLINQPGGNAIIIAGMRALNQYDQARGQIANQYQQNIVGGMPQQTALQQYRQAISDLDASTPSLESMISSNGAPETQQAAASVTAEAIGGMQRDQLDAIDHRSLDDAALDALIRRYEELGR